MKAIALLPLLLLAACNSPGDSEKGAGAPPPSGGPPAPPPYQMRAELPVGDRLAVQSDGAALFSNRCGACHLAGGMGTNLLTKQRIAAGEPPQNGLLANRTDLTADYVKSVVRMGKVAMPRISRTEVTDSELDAIAAYLGKADK